MANELDERGVVPSAVVRRGTLTGILQEIAQTPEVALGERWDERLRPGAVVAGRFELVREVGRGGFGVVYEARDRQLGRTVAFKAVRAGDRAALREERLVREAEAAARLSHPNIVTLHDVGRTEHGPYLVLELLRGQTLADRLDQGPLPVREALRVAVEIARGLAHAHGEGVVHRDLKPANVFLLDEGQVKLLDFGLAHALGRRRQDGGTPAFMAPEQWRGAPEDERTDVFALGVLLFRMLSGELPFPEDDGGKAAQASRPAPALDVPEVPALGAFVARMLKKDPVERPRDGAAVLAALAAFQRELDRTPSSPSAPVRARRRPRRAAALAAAAALAFAAIVAALLVVRPWDRVPGDAPGRPVTVAVADFANQTGEPELDGLSGMLITSLEQSQRLAVLTRVRMLDVLRQMGKTDVKTVDESLGRELALSAGVRALVLATIRRFDQIYAIELKVLDPVRSEYLFTVKEEGRGKASVPAMIDRLSERTRARLWETPAEVQASSAKVADLTTSSLEAYQHYFRGEQLKEAIRYEPAVEAYRRAIAVDPDFALAHYRLAYLGKFTILDEGERRAHIAAALRAADRVPAKERVLIQAWNAVMEGRSQEAHALYERAVEAYPQDKEVLFMAGDQWLHEDEWARALPYFQRSVALDPTFEPSLMHQADCLAALGRTEELAEVARRWTERAPSAPAFRALTQAHGAAGRVEEAVASARRALDLDGTSYSRVVLAEALILAERYAEAEALLRPFATPSASRLDRSHHVMSFVAALAYQGKRREALRAVDEFPEEVEGKRGARRALKLELLHDDPPSDAAVREARALSRDGDPHVTKGMAIALAWRGDLDGAAEAAARLPPEMRPHYDAAVAWRRGEVDRALSLARELAKKGGAEEGRAPALWVLAHAAFDARKDDEVVAAADALRSVPGGGWRTWGLADAQLLAARALERKGERAKARARVDQVLETWKHADPDLPMLARARELRSRLAARTG
ncbi:MAG TPA: protein kinase [Anaeromyxobacter sp.]|nr:protein kinase [Anaeromyxobacter sp.]